MQQKSIMFYKKSYDEIFSQLEKAAKQGDLQAFTDFIAVSTPDEFRYTIKRNALYFSILAIANSHSEVLKFIYENSNKLIRKEILTSTCIRSNKQTMVVAAAKGNMEILEFLVESYVALKGKEKLKKLPIPASLDSSLANSHFQIWRYLKEILPVTDWKSYALNSANSFIKSLRLPKLSKKLLLEKMRTLLVFAAFIQSELEEINFEGLFKKAILLEIASRCGYLEWIKFIKKHDENNWLSTELVNNDFEILICAIKNKNFHVAEWIIGEIQSEKLIDFAQQVRNVVVRTDLFGEPQEFRKIVNRDLLGIYGNPRHIKMTNEQRQTIGLITNLDKLDDFNLKLNELLHNKMSLKLTLLCGKFLQSSSMQCINDVVTNVVSAEVNLNNMEAVVMHVIKTYRDCKTREEKVDPQSFAFAQKVRESAFLSESNKLAK